MTAHYLATLSESGFDGPYVEGLIPVPETVEPCDFLAYVLAILLDRFPREPREMRIGWRVAE